MNVYSYGDLLYVILCLLYPTHHKLNKILYKKQILIIYEKLLSFILEITVKKSFLWIEQNWLITHKLQSVVADGSWS